MSILVRVAGAGGVQIYDAESFTVDTEISVNKIIEEYEIETGYKAVSPIHFLEVETIDGNVLIDWIASGKAHQVLN